MKKNNLCLGFAGIGFLYGAFLTSMGILFAGAGHGSYVPIEVFSSPLIRFGVIASFFGGPFMWSLIWYLVSLSVLKPQNRKAKLASILFLAFHYFGIVYTFAIADHSALVKLKAHFDPKCHNALGMSISIFPFVVYFIGQALLCALLSKPAQDCSIAATTNE